MLNTTFYYILMFAVVGVPFYFHHRASKLQLEGVRATDADAEIATRINGITARLTVFIIASLYLMSFIAINLKNTTFQEFGYFASLFHFSFCIPNTQRSSTASKKQDHATRTLSDIDSQPIDFHFVLRHLLCFLIIDSPPWSDHFLADAGLPELFHSSICQTSFRCTRNAPF